MKGVTVSPTVRRPFQFAALKRTDDDDYLDRPLNLKALATIRIQVYRVGKLRGNLPQSLNQH